MYKSLIIIALMLLLVGTGCKKQTVPQGEQAKIEKIDTNVVLKTTPLGDAAAANLQLQYKPEAGKTYVYSLTSSIEEDSKVTADSVMAQRSKQVVNYRVHVKALSVEDDGTVDAQFTVTAIKLVVTVGSQKIEYTSGTKLDSAKRMQFLDYEGLINSAFGARISKIGEVLEVYKTDKIINKFLSLRNVSRDTIPAEEIAQFTTNIVNAGLRPLVKQIFRELSKNAVSKNSSWEVAQQPINLQIVAFESKSINTLTGVEEFESDKLAKIKVGLQTNVLKNPEAAKNKINIKKSDLNGTGDLYFNLSKGMFQKNKTMLMVSVSMDGIAPTRQGPKKYSSERYTATTYYLDLLEVK